MSRIILVPSARLELAQLSPLPPQDSVSTNFTTTAALNCLNCVRILADFAFQTEREFTLNLPVFSKETGNKTAVYFAGICGATGAGATGTSPAGATAGAGAVTVSKTLLDVAGRRLPK